LARCLKPFRPAVRLDKVVFPTIVDRILADASENWDVLGDGLVRLVKEQGLRSLMVCSSLAGEGVTTVSLCVAAALVKRMQLSILVLDGDFRNPMLAKTMLPPMSNGLEDVIVKNLSIDRALCASPADRISFLPVVHGFVKPEEAVKSERLAELTAVLRDHFDLIVVDGGNAFSGKAPGLMCSGVDAALLVRDPDTSSEHLLEQLDRYLEVRGIDSLGVIENFADAVKLY
jgi:Mrp family chromosome partitioning ATPase